MSDIAAEARDLRMRYGSVDVLNGVDFEVRTGEVVALLGPNGAGKTTTIEILEGFRARSAGQVTVLGTDPAQGGEQWRARLGVVLQSWRDHAKWRVMSFVFSGVLGVTVLLSVDREDGTLLRAKATPGGMTAYVIGKIVNTSAVVLNGAAGSVILGLIAFSGVQLTAAGLVTLARVSLLGLLATIPYGVIVGALMPSPRTMPLVMLPFGGLAAISGLFYPVTHLAGWLQAVGQLFPLYWLGLGMRAALLPSSLASVELGQSWRLPWVFLVLALWAVLGLVAAPAVLRRVARRESASRVAERRMRAMLRAT
jgi:ABC-2 type transport system permease protein